MSFSSCDIKMLHGIWYKIGGLNQEISYSNLPQVISRVFQVIWNSFKGGFIAWFWTIIQLLIRLSAFFGSCGMIMLHGIWYKLEDWIQRYLIQTYHRLSQEYFKSYRIVFRVALWLDFEQLSSYLFISRCLFRAAIIMLHGIWYKIGGLNQQISYSNLPQVISRVFQVI